MWYVSLDACFRIKRYKISDEEKDPILGSGWAYFVEDAGYKEVLAEYGEQQEVSPTSTLHDPIADALAAACY